MHLKFHTAVSFLSISFYNIPNVVGHVEQAATIKENPVTGKHFQRDSVVPLRDPRIFSRPTRPEVDKPRRVVQLDGSKFPIKPALPGFDPLKSDFIRGGLIRVASPPPEQRMTVAPIVGPLQASVPTGTFQVSVKPIEPDIVRRQKELEPRDVTPPPELPTTFPTQEFPTSWTSWTITTFVMGHTGPVEFVIIDVTRPQEPASRIEYEYPVPGRERPGHSYGGPPIVVEASPTSEPLPAKTAESSSGGSETAIPESSQPSTLDNGLQEDQDLGTQRDSEGVSKNSQNTTEGSHIPEMESEPFRHRERTRKRIRRHQARKN
ncbi:hypothetical protein TWF718_002022 [Orbilia javanica]|uniref:Uncharacterized protein n=1 Tax=Orbilia javanica TaxID=47235 RepID=A0AAN8MZS3_9PEZI